jgi:hypothetical protein
MTAKTRDATILVDVERLRELTQDNRKLSESNLRLSARILELEQRVKELSLEWAADPTIREKRELLPPTDPEEESDA